MNISLDPSQYVGLMVSSKDGTNVRTSVLQANGAKLLLHSVCANKSPSAVSMGCCLSCCLDVVEQNYNDFELVLLRGVDQVWGSHW